MCEQCGSPAGHHQTSADCHRCRCCGVPVDEHHWDLRGFDDDDLFVVDGTVWVGETLSDATPMTLMWAAVALPMVASGAIVVARWLG